MTLDLDFPSDDQMITANEFFGNKCYEVVVDVYDSPPQRDTFRCYTRMKPDDSRFVGFMYRKAIDKLKPTFGTAINVLSATEVDPNENKER